MEELLENLYREHRQGLYSFALSILANRAAAEDAVQAAFARLFERQRQGRPQNGALLNGQTWDALVAFGVEDRNALVAYVYKTVRNCAVDHQRRGVRQERMSQVLFERRTDPVSNQAENEMVKKDRNETLMLAIESLSQHDREAIMLKTFSGLTFEQVGEVLQTSPKTIATRYRRALGKLKVQLKGKL